MEIDDGAEEECDDADEVIVEEVCEHYDENSDSCHCEEIWEMIGHPAGFECFVKPFWGVCKFYKVKGKRYLGMPKEVWLSLIVIIVAISIGFVFGRLSL